MKDTGLRNLPLHDFAGNQIWCAIVALACELTAWTQMLVLAAHPGRRWEPNGSGCGCSPPRLIQQHPPVPANPTSAPDWKPAPPETAPAHPSHPQATIIPNTRARAAGQCQPPTHERSGLSVSVG
ncbi:MAG: hypothetical protein QOC93_2978 [Actinomycetota bacterium]|nr:hypothetical protein [Actinomycetota bacterium]